MNFSIDTAPPVCPYCKGGLPKRPTRKSRCPLCGETILVKYAPDDRVKRLVTQAQAENIEVLWQSYGQGKEQERRDGFGAIFSLRKGMSETEQLAALREFSDDASKSLQLRKMAVFHLAANGKQGDAKELATLGYRFELEDFMNRGFVEVTIRGGVSPCYSCGALKGKIVSMKEALLSPVPNRSCSRWQEQSCCCAFWAPVTPSSP